MKKAQRLIEDFLEEIISQIPHNRLSKIGCSRNGSVLRNCFHDRDKDKGDEKSGPAARINLKLKTREQNKNRGAC